jgi:hypothetical protein
MQPAIDVVLDPLGMAALDRPADDEPIGVGAGPHH